MKLSQQQLLNLISDSYVDYRGKNVNGKCPQCGAEEFGISIHEDNHPFNCYRKKRCGFQGNIYTLLQFLGKSKEFLSERPINVFDKVELKLEDDERKELDLELPEIIPPPLWRRVKEDAYLRSRGFTNGDFEKYEVGRSVLAKDYVTFLVRMNGKLVGYVKRSERTKEWIDTYNKKQKETGGEMYRRYDNSLTDFHKMLFGYDELTVYVSDVILVEGPFSKTKTDTNLNLDNNSTMKCCATFGAKISPEQIVLLRRKGVKRIWLWFEADVLDKVKEIASNLNDFDVRVSYLSGMDPNEIGTDEAIALLENAKNYLDFNMSYVKFDVK